jgi:hypothetical protein
MFIGATRRCVGGIVALIGVILILPSIGLFFVADWVYGKPIYTAETAMTSSDRVKNITINGVMKQSNDYDIKVIVVARVENIDQLGSFNVKMDSIKTGSGLAAFPPTYPFSDNQVNESTTISDTWELKDKFAENANLVLIFNLTTSVNINSVSVKVEIYENPNRPLVETITKIGAILLIPGIIVIICGACIAGPQRGGTTSGRTRVSGAKFISRKH